MLNIMEIFTFRQPRQCAKKVEQPMFGHGQPLRVVCFYPGNRTGFPQCRDKLRVGHADCRPVSQILHTCEHRCNPPGLLLLVQAKVEVAFQDTCVPFLPTFPQRPSPIVKQAFAPIRADRDDRHASRLPAFQVLQCHFHQRRQIRYPGQDDLPDLPRKCRFLYRPQLFQIRVCQPCRRQLVEVQQFQFTQILPTVPFRTMAYIHSGHPFKTNPALH